MTEIGRFDFHDAESDSNASAILRHVANGIGLTITVEKNGDIEVVLSKDDYSKLLAWMQSYS